MISKAKLGTSPLWLFFFLCAVSDQGMRKPAQIQKKQMIPRWHVDSEIEAMFKSYPVKEAKQEKDLR